MLGRTNNGVATTANASNAQAARMPRNTTRASCRRKPACTSRNCSFPISDGDFGMTRPTRFTVSITRSYDTASVPERMGRPLTSPSRRRITAALPGASANAPAVTSIVMKANASSGMRMVTLYLDLDDPPDPEEPDHLQADGARNEHVADAL